MQNFTLVLVANSENGPNWAEVEVTPAFIKTLDRLRYICQSEGLQSVTAPIPPDRWDCESDLIAGSSLSVFRDYFYFEAYLKHDDYSAQTLSCKIDSLKQIAEGIENPLPYGFYMSKGVIFYDDPDLAELYFNESQE